MSEAKFTVMATLSNDSFVMVNKKIAKHLGFNEAGLLAELISMYRNCENPDMEKFNFYEGNWFYLTQPKIEENIGLKRREHDTGMKILSNAGVIERKQMGLPMKVYYEIKWDEILQILSKKDSETAPLSACTKRTGKEGRNVQASVDETYRLGSTKRTTSNKELKELKKRTIKKKEQEIKDYKDMSETDSDEPVQPSQLYLIPDDPKPNLDQQFEELWLIYPRKEGKSKAKASFIKFMKEKQPPKFDDIKAGIFAYADYIVSNNTDPQYIKMGSTWFGNRSWEDEYDSTQEYRPKSKNALLNMYAEETGYSNRRTIIV